jgi:zinc/manganese transport system substrate-binding protein
MTSKLLISTTAALLVPAALGLAPRPAAAQGSPVRIVASLSTYAAIAREIAGDRGSVVSIGRGDENPHYVQPRPSFALQLRRADLFVSTGLDLELWVPTLLDKANNPKVNDGGPGYVTAYTGVHLMDVPTSVSRSEGDIHAFGNPHIWADPINGIVIGQNILTGLKRVSPANADYFQQRYDAWRERVLAALVGDTLVKLLGADAVFNLADKDQLWDFLQEQRYQGKPLADRIGGWLKEGEVFRGQKMVCYHKEWDYFSRRFDIPCVDFIEPKPGIPPTPGHVAELIRLVRTEHIPVILTANFYDQSQARTIAERAGATAVIVPANAAGAPGTDTYIDLVSLWVKDLAQAFRAYANR